MQRRDQSRYRWLGCQCLQSARACIMLVWLALTLAANPVAAQTTTTYSNTAAGTINAATTCTAPLVRNFTVGAGYIVGDVDLGLLATHSWPGDLRIILHSHPATRRPHVDRQTTQ